MRTTARARDPSSRSMVSCSRRLPSRFFRDAVRPADGATRGEQRGIAGANGAVDAAALDSLRTANAARRAPLQQVLIANRGEIAVRIARAAGELGIRSVGVYSRDDEDSLHWRRCDDAVALSQSGAAAYLDIESLVNAALNSGCDALHPGYGFLSENASFARHCAAAGIMFIGPRPQVLELFGDKAAARQLAEQQGIPVARGLSARATLQDARAFMAALGGDAMEVMIKAVAGGGDLGMRVVESAGALEEAYESARSEAKAAIRHRTDVLHWKNWSRRHATSRCK